MFGFPGHSHLVLRNKDIIIKIANKMKSLIFVEHAWYFPTDVIPQGAQGNDEEIAPKVTSVSLKPNISQWSLQSSFFTSFSNSLIRTLYLYYPLFLTINPFLRHQQLKVMSKILKFMYCWLTYYWKFWLFKWYNNNSYFYACIKRKSP